MTKKSPILAVVLGVAVLAVAYSRTSPRSPEALKEALSAYDKNPTADNAKIVDAVAGQKDAAVSRLFWYTDLDQALAAAKASGRPVLSLRLLGKLDEDLSCANSRFFRTTLYANQQIAAYLRENYVLHWESVRPAPVLTVDYGDGRKIVTTITGNSIHYVLTPDGDIADALPGLYSPGRFLELIKEADTASRKATHDRVDRFASLAKVGPPVKVIGASARPDAAPASKPPAAGRAADIARTKVTIERPTVHVFSRSIDRYAGRWRILPAAVEAVKFDDASLELMRKKMPADTTKSDMLEMLNTLRRTMLEDQMLNEFELRPRIMAQLAAVPDVSLKDLNNWVYTNVFETPGNDPWIGLKADAFNGVENGGLVVPAQSAAR
ncbi:MAG: hypothetical protein QM754_05770 [Tepidisphaeraceae bacterium]